MARWEGVLDLQIKVHDWLTSPAGTNFGAGFIRDAFENPGPEEQDLASRGLASRGLADVKAAEGLGRLWSQSVGVGAFNAEPIYVEPEMMQVVEAAVSGFVPEPLLETDLITPNGFLALPRSMWLLDSQGKRLSWRIAVWHPIADGILLTLFHDSSEPDDIDAETQAKYGRRWEGIYPTHTVAWRYGTNHPGTNPGSVDLLADPAWPRGGGSALTAHRQLQATWRLLNQHLAVRTKERPSRAFMKRARAASLPGEHVTIVRLRRPAQERQPDEPGAVNWTHQWIVGGHWRNQWYPSLSLHRQIWISPYVKGPDELPLIVNKARIFQFVR